MRTSCYKTFALILENYPILTRVSASLRRAAARRKNVRFANAQVRALELFVSMPKLFRKAFFWFKTRVKVGLFSNIAQHFL